MFLRYNHKCYQGTRPTGKQGLRSLGPAITQEKSEIRPVRELSQFLNAGISFLKFQTLCHFAIGIKQPQNHMFEISGIYSFNSTENPELTSLSLVH